MAKFFYIFYVHLLYIVNLTAVPIDIAIYFTTLVLLITYGTADRMQYPEVETDIPFAEYPPTFASLQERVDAAFKSLAELVETEACLGVDVADSDITAARDVLLGAAKPSDKVLSSPGTVIHLKAILDEYDKVVVQSSAQLRTYVTNKLIEDSANPDPRIRLKCYELLGKISDVGLFTDKSEVTLKHRPTEELEQLLRERLMKTLEGEAMEITPADLESSALIIPEPIKAVISQDIQA